MAAGMPAWLLAAFAATAARRGTSAPLVPALPATARLPLLACSLHYHSFSRTAISVLYMTTLSPQQYLYLDFSRGKRRSISTHSFPQSASLNFMNSIWHYWNGFRGRLPTYGDLWHAAAVYLALAGRARRRGATAPHLPPPSRRRSAFRRALGLEPAGTVFLLQLAWPVQYMRLLRCRHSGRSAYGMPLLLCYSYRTLKDDRRGIGYLGLLRLLPACITLFCGAAFMGGAGCMTPAAGGVVRSLAGGGRRQAGSRCELALAVTFGLSAFSLNGLLVHGASSVRSLNCGRTAYWHARALAVIPCARSSFATQPAASSGGAVDFVPTNIRRRACTWRGEHRSAPVSPAPPYQLIALCALQHLLFTHHYFLSCHCHCYVITSFCHNITLPRADAAAGWDVYPVLPWLAAFCRRLLLHCLRSRAIMARAASAPAHILSTTVVA